jgi:hypothetical protein
MLFQPRSEFRGRSLIFLRKKRLRLRLGTVPNLERSIVTIPHCPLFNEPRKLLRPKYAECEMRTVSPMLLEVIQRANVKCEHRHRFQLQLLVLACVSKWASPSYSRAVKDPRCCIRSGLQSPHKMILCMRFALKIFPIDPILGHGPAFGALVLGSSGRSVWAGEDCTGGGLLYSPASSKF